MDDSSFLVSLSWGAAFACKAEVLERGDWLVSLGFFFSEQSPDWGKACTQFEPANLKHAPRNAETRRLEGVRNLLVDKETQAH